MVSFATRPTCPRQDLCSTASCFRIVRLNHLGQGVVIVASYRGGNRINDFVRFAPACGQPGQEKRGQTEGTDMRGGPTS